MGESKRFCWLKLKEDFFRQKDIKKLRKLAGGDVFIIIYLKMLLRSLKDDGRLYYEGVEDDFPAELALDIDEEEENVKMTIAYLMAKGILVQHQSDEYELMTAHEMTDSECDSAARVRRLRAQRLLANSQEALHGNATVTGGNGAVTTSNVEIDIEKELDKEKEIEVDAKPKRKRFTPPTLDEVRAYAEEKQWTKQEFNAERFVDFYASKGWKVGRDTMKDWKASARGWVSRYRQEHPDQAEKKPDYGSGDETEGFW